MPLAAILTWRSRSCHVDITRAILLLKSPGSSRDSVILSVFPKQRRNRAKEIEPCFARPPEFYRTTSMGAPRGVASSHEPPHRRSRSRAGTYVSRKVSPRGANRFGEGHVWHHNCGRSLPLVGRSKQPRDPGVD